MSKYQRLQSLGYTTEYMPSARALRQDNAQ